MLFCPLTRAQTSPAGLDSLFSDWNSRLDKLDLHNPEVIALHCLFSEDVLQEMEAFRRDIVPQLPRNREVDYYEATAAFYKTYYRAQSLSGRLQALKARVPDMFCKLAEQEINFGNCQQALYYLERALQYEKFHPKALLMKADLSLRLHHFKESVALVHLLYTKAGLDDAQENAVSDFTLKLYDYLYSLGDSLVKSGRSAEALEVFLSLEQFCNNMPSGYCNDDYYRGILRSRKGIYESYLAIAKEAGRRGNTEMAQKFYSYAEEYRKKGGLTE